MRIGFLIEIIENYYTEKITYETIDRFIELNDETNSLETQIMKKYPTLNLIENCDDNIVCDKYNEKNI
jgi:hypothetical protein